MIPMLSMTVQALFSSSAFGSDASSDSNCLSIRSNSLRDAEISYSWFKIWSILLEILADCHGSNNISLVSRGIIIGSDM